MGKKKAVKRPYKAYEYKGIGRVKGPNFIDVHIEEVGCAGCTAMYMNIAYEQGRKDERNHR